MNRQLYRCAVLVIVAHLAAGICIAAPQGVDYRLDDEVFGRGLIQRGLDQLWERYDQAFSDLPAFLPPPPEPETVHARHLYTLLLNLDDLTARRDHVHDAFDGTTPATLATSGATGTSRSPRPSAPAPDRALALSNRTVSHPGALI